MKKILIAFLFSISCACAFTAVGCKGEGDSSSSSSSSTPTPPAIEGEYSVHFTEGEGYTFSSQTQIGEKVAHGTSVSFTVDKSVFYAGYPVVYVNETAIAPDDNGVYTVTVTNDIEISVEGIQKAVSNMAGSGTMEDAFVVTSPIDLIYIAEQVNKGVQAYVTGAYVLANDIDCGGETLQVIGDMSTENSYFSGCFSCVTDSETGSMERFTISNFVLDTDDTNYVGLFGTVYADENVTSSGLFYGIRLDNFTVNATIADDAEADGNTIVAGGLIGYGVGANLYLCDAMDGEINIYGDTNYFSFAGGLIGYQQGFYSAYADSYFPSEIVYSTADVDVRILNGTALYAGGIAGYLSTDVEAGATAFIHNSYATGNVSGALRSGGIAGGLGQYTSISNCYATGNISAIAKQSPDFLTDEAYAKAYAGGLVGYAENDTVASDSFFAGKVSANSAYSSAFTNPAIAGGDKAGTANAVGRKYVSYNCVSEVNLSQLSYFEETLGWGDYDWVFAKEAYPTINYASSGSTVSASFAAYYVAPDGATVKVNGQERFDIEYFNSSISASNVYSPFGNYVMNGMDYYFEADNGYLSYGYFFDEACTMRVPFSFVAQRNLTLYIGFADPTPIVGMYYIENEKGEPLSIELNDKGIVTYSDGKTEQKTYYQYDGTNLIIEDARLARYYTGEIIVDESDTNSVQDPSFDMYRYDYYDFLGQVKDGVLSLYDGVYFKKEAPLVAGAQPPAPSVYDAFKGVWTKRATVNKAYVFDGLGNWTYTYKEYVRNGYSYTINNVESAKGSYTLNADGTISFTHNGTNYTASFNSDGFLEIIGNGKPQLYYAENSFVGTWNVGNVTIELLGITSKGYGKATVTYGDGYMYDLIYEASETDGYVVLYWADKTYVKGTVFGYYTYDVASNTLLSTIVDPESVSTGYMQVNLFVTDDYNGEWVSNSQAFLYADFSFNGNGLYSFLYGQAGVKGTLTITVDNVSTEVTYTLQSTQVGTFAYEGVLYTMTYNEDDNTVVLTSANETASLERKDLLAGQKFVDKNGNEYDFNGKGNLSTGGILTVNGNTTYGYKTSENGWIIYDNDTEVGTLILHDNHYDLTISGVLNELYLSNQFMGEWAVGGAVELFVIGPTDLNGKVSATYKGYPVELEQNSLTLLTFKYKEDNMPITYYVFVIHDEVLGGNILVLSQYANLSGEYMICTKANELYGTWQSANGFTLEFDGVTSGSYAFGTAYLSRNTGSRTPYYYTIEEKGITLWSQGLLGNRTYYYKLEMLDITSADLTNKNVFVQYDAQGNAVSAFLRTEVDGLYLTEAKDENGTTYFFDGLGNIYVGEEIVYTYKITAYNTDNTTNLKVTDTDGKTYSAVLNYKNSNNVKLTIGEEITE